MAIFHVRSWRNRLGWSRKTAAEHLGVSVHTIKSYELLRRELPNPVRQLMMRMEEEFSGKVAVQSDTAIIGGGFLSPSGNDMKGVYSFIPSYGETARKVAGIYHAYDKPVFLSLSKMADYHSQHETSEDLKCILEDFCNDENITTMHICCTSIDFDPVKLVRERRPDMQIISYGAAEPQFYGNSAHADYSFVSSLEKEKTKNKSYAVLDGQGRTIHRTDEKESCIAGLIETIVTKHNETRAQHSENEHNTSAAW